MPLPFDPKLINPNSRGPKRAARENGITLKQLRNLQEFLRRLCKAGLLKHTSEFSKASGKYGERIKWTGLNMHDINEEVIKQLVPKEHSCSWVELITSEPQTSKFFVSHNWAEAFRDFMHSIETHAATMCCRIHDVFFVCTFANDQWNLDFGEQLERSPFYLALQDSDHVVLVLDKQATALERLWCVFEINIALRLEKEFDIVTPLGMIGDKRMASGGPIIEAVGAVDVRQAKASNAADMRQILNYIAKVPEEEGLSKDKEGRKQLSEGLDVQETNSYEEQLMAAHAQEFETLNGRIQLFADRESERLQEAKEEGCSVDDVSLRAMSLAQLRAMCTRAKKFIFDPAMQEWRNEKNIKSWSDIDFLHLLGTFIKEKTAAQNKRSYFEVIAREPQKPEYIIACALKTKVSDLMASLEWHAEARCLPDAVTYWIISTAACQAEVDNYINAKARPPSFEAMPHADGMVCVLDTEAGLLGRALPAVEVFDCLDRKKILDLVCPTGALATTKPFKEGWEFGNFSPSIAEKMVNYDIRTIEGKRYDSGENAGMDHAEMVKCLVAGVEYKAGMKAPIDCDLYDVFNDQLRSRVVGPVLREAAYEGNVEQMLEIFRKASYQKVHLDAKQLCGHSGEMALHAAAAAGKNEAVQVLVLKQASVNVQDLDGETPLHYAALAGQHGTVELLLRMGADISIESYLGETAAEVAEQNPASFLGVQTKKVVEVLDASKIERDLQELEKENAELGLKLRIREEEEQQLKEQLRIERDETAVHSK
mmetsp:Transcript_16079/g.36906  ORF Transcript_16079/g.36906 Transcript_16079/m.36906 type:complete len:767 (+) Transcript_16079:33-2333(+)